MSTGNFGPLNHVTDRIDTSTTRSSSSTGGARQGDPLGTLLYALVAQPILEEVADAVPSVEIDAFADDAGFHGNDLPEVVRA